jgi:hypothetical protein
MVEVKMVSQKNGKRHEKIFMAKTEIIAAI